MSQLWKLVVGAIAWGAAVSGVLALARLPGDYAHSLCGPWGCLPPLQALAAMHLFWVFVLVPLVTWGMVKASPRQLEVAGVLLFCTSLLGILVITGRDLLAWLPTVPPWVQAHWPRRVLFTLVMYSDVPFAQVLLAGAICWVWAKQLSRRRTNQASG